MNAESNQPGMHERRGILRNKYYLYLTEFFAGMSVMAVELGPAGFWRLISAHLRLYGRLLSERL